jgi:hypothetical protein
LLRTTNIAAEVRDLLAKEVDLKDGAEAEDIDMEAAVEQYPADGPSNTTAEVKDLQDAPADAEFTIDEGATPQTPDAPASLANTVNMDAVFSALVFDMQNTWTQGRFHRQRRSIPFFEDPLHHNERSNYIPTSAMWFSNVSYLLNPAAEGVPYTPRPFEFAPSFARLSYIPGSLDIERTSRLQRFRQLARILDPGPVRVRKQADRMDKTSASSVRKQTNFILVNYRRPTNMVPKRQLKQIIAERERREWFTNRVAQRHEAERAKLAADLGETKAGIKDMDIKGVIPTTSFDRRRALEDLAEVAFKKEIVRITAKSATLRRMGATAPVAKPESKGVTDIRVSNRRVKATDARMPESNVLLSTDSSAIEQNSEPKPEPFFVLVDYVSPTKDHKWFSKSSTRDAAAVQSATQSKGKPPGAGSESFVTQPQHLRSSLASPLAPGFMFGHPTGMSSYVLIDYTAPDGHPDKHFSKKAPSEPRVQPEVKKPSAMPHSTHQTTKTEKRTKEPLPSDRGVARMLKMQAMIQAMQAERQERARKTDRGENRGKSRSATSSPAPSKINRTINTKATPSRPRHPRAAAKGKRSGPTAAARLHTLVRCCHRCLSVVW